MDQENSVSNLDIKRHGLGLNHGLSPLKVLETYRLASTKKKLEMISIVEVIRHRENNYDDAFQLILSFEKASNLLELLSSLSKQKLQAKVLEHEGRPRNETAAEEHSHESDKKPIEPQESNFKVIIQRSAAVILGLILISFIYNANRTNNPVIDKFSDINESSIIEHTYINLESKYGHNYAYLKVNGSGDRFLLDTGASYATVSQNYIERHKRNGYINRSKHFLREDFLTTATGETVGVEIWQIPAVTIGKEIIHDVLFAAIDGIDDDSFLLGMTVLNKLGDFTIDLQNHKIILKK
jgi:clan AA aspartic protease (TIGR02281 family)